MRTSFQSAIALLISVSLAAPINDALQSVLGRPSNSRKIADPFKPDYSDPYDHKVDSIGDNLKPLPWRNGHGSTILGPQNTDRQRQNPDLIRPPSTDHGDMKNMRWSFADSHIRIEVSISEFARAHGLMLRKGGRVDSTNYDSGVGLECSISWCEHATRRRRHSRIALAQGSRMGLCA
jgi:hypothetical protein